MLHNQQLLQILYVRGFNVTYTVGATGTGLTYQWYKGVAPAGVPLVNGGLPNLSSISGATTSALTITNTALPMQVVIMLWFQEPVRHR